MSDPLTTTTLSYAAYAEIPADGQRWEFLDGEVFVTPAPSPAHQFAVLRVSRFLEDNIAAFAPNAIAFVSPIDVILNDAEIVQPDVVVARRGQVSDRGIEGAPLLLVEVVSPTRPGLDREVKARRYAANGVERFWLADPAARTMECFDLVDGTYVPVATARGIETLAVAPGLHLELARLWMPSVPGLLVALLEPRAVKRSPARCREGTRARCRRRSTRRAYGSPDEARSG